MRPTRQTISPGESAFTLLEICLAVFIALLIALAAVPSINGLLEEKRAKKLFQEFDKLAHDAGTRAVTEHRAYVLEWDDSGVAMRPLSPDNGEEWQGQDRVDFGLKHAPELVLPAALVKDPPREWTFWPSGTCEPATVICHLADAPWTATYDGLTEQPAFSSP